MSLDGYGISISEPNVKVSIHSTPLWKEGRGYKIGGDVYFQLKGIAPLSLLYEKEYEVEKASYEA